MIELTILLGTFLAGMTAGVLLILRLAAAHDGLNLRATPPTRVAAAARLLTGLRIQAPAVPAGGKDDGR